MASKAINSTDAPNSTMANKANPDRVAVNIPSDVREGLMVYMAKNGFKHRAQSDAVTKILRQALTEGGYLTN